MAPRAADGLRLHTYAASANCLKVRLLLRLLGVECELVEVDIFAGQTLTPAFAALNPLRETPVLQDGELTLTQSNAILGYLAAETPWAGTTRADRALAQAWMCFEQERVMPGIGGVRFRLVTGRATLTELAAQLQTGREALVTLEQHLAGRDWLVGPSPTIADLSVWAYSHLAPEVGPPPGQHS